MSLSTYPLELKNVHSNKNLFMNVHMFHNNQKVKKFKCSDGKKNKMYFPHNGILFC